MLTLIFGRVISWVCYNCNILSIVRYYLKPQNMYRTHKTNTEVNTERVFETTNIVLI